MVKKKRSTQSNFIKYIAAIAIPVAAIFALYSANPTMFTGAVSYTLPKVTNVEVNAEYDGYVEITFSGVAGAAKYNLYYSKNIITDDNVNRLNEDYRREVRPSSATGTKYGYIYGLENGTNYYFTVVASNEDGTVRSRISELVRGIPEEGSDPAEVPNIVTSLDIIWTPDSFANKFRSNLLYDNFPANSEGYYSEDYEVLRSGTEKYTFTFETNKDYTLYDFKLITGKRKASTGVSAYTVDSIQDVKTITHSITARTTQEEEKVSWWGKCADGAICPVLSNEREYFLQLIARVDINGANNTNDLGETATYYIPIKFIDEDDGGGDGGDGDTGDKISSCDLDLELDYDEDTDGDYNPEFGDIIFSYEARSAELSRGKVALEVSGPHRESPIDPEKDTDFREKLIDTTKSFRIQDEKSWNGLDDDDDEVDSGKYLAVLTISDPDDADEKCVTSEKFDVDYSDDNGNSYVSVGVDSPVFQLGYEEFFGHVKSSVKSVRTVVNLYAQGGHTPLATVFNQCERDESCPTDTGALNAGTKDFIVNPFIRTVGTYYLKASIKTESGNVYEAFSPLFQAVGQGFQSNCNFTDVTPFDPDYKAIVRACELGIMKGDDSINTPIKTFRPDNPIIRIEGVAIANRLARCISQPTFSPDYGFTDMAVYNDPNSSWMLLELGKGIQCLKLTGYTDRTFRPTTPLAQAEGWKVVLEAAKTGGIAQYVLNANFAATPWYLDYEQLLLRNYIQLNPAGTVMNRRDMARLIYSLEVSRLIIPL